MLLSNYFFGKAKILGLDLEATAKHGASDACDRAWSFEAVKVSQTTSSPNHPHNAQRLSKNNT